MREFLTIESEWDDFQKQTGASEQYRGAFYSGAFAAMDVRRARVRVLNDPQPDNSIVAEILQLAVLSKSQHQADRFFAPHAAKPPPPPKLDFNE